MTRAPYSYRKDPDVPEFDDSSPVFIFDNVCVLCSGGAAFLMKHDVSGKVAFTSAQDRLGQALCNHYELDWDESYLFIRNGRPFTKSSGYFELAKALGGFWRLGLVFQIVPRPIRDWLYDMVARNRYKWFGKTENACALLSEEQRSRLL